jgi:hypothetical protein
MPRSCRCFRNKTKENTMRTGICLYCGKEFEVPLGVRYQKHCSRKCCAMFYRKNHSELCTARRKKYDKSRVTSGEYDEKRLRHMFHKTSEWYNTTLESQGNECAICGSTLAGGRSPRNRFHIDHDPACCPKAGKSCGRCVRGLLCATCNLALGKFKSVELLEKAIQYLKKHLREKTQ